MGVTSNDYFGTGGTGSLAAIPGLGAGGEITAYKASSAMSNDLGASNLLTSASTLNFAYLKEGKISVQTSDYFAVGSTIEVLGTTWSSGYICADAAGVEGAGGAGVLTAAGCTASTCGDLDGSACAWAQHNVGTDVATGNNKYRKFKVTGHVTNEFNREFAKLDSFPADDGITDATALKDRPDYNLKITSNNATVRTYPPTGTGIAAKITLNEVQIITLGNGQDGADNPDVGGTGVTATVWKLYYKGEESQNMDHSSTPAQVAEEINGFSALSGPVTVAGISTGTSTGFPRYSVTFDAKDGDVAEMTAVADSGTVAISTQANGWSIEGPVGLGLDTMQAGGIINVTAPEVCTFEGTGIGTNLVGYWCYAGICGPAMVDAEATDPTPDGILQSDIQNAIRAIKDDTGAAILSTAAVDATITDSLIVTMPLAAGMSCDHLELRVNTNAAVVKSVDKNNNGKQFKITRSFIQKTAIPTITDETQLTCTAGLCMNALAGVDSVVLGGTCDAAHADDGGRYPIHRTVVSTSSNNAAGVGQALSAASTVTISTGAATDLGTGTTCSLKLLARHVITLDSAPTESLVAVLKNLLYTSPVGSCSVAETTKGTYESFECSNRGACDGKSGLCTCYEGYSGQSCQTQTVLV